MVNIARRAGKRLKAVGKSVASRFRKAGGRLLSSLDAAGERHRSIAVGAGAIRGFFQHRMTLHSGNFAYSAFLSLFPLILLVLSVIGFLFHYNPSAMQATVDYIRKLAPDFGAGAVTDISNSVTRLRGVVGVLGFIGLLWSVSRISYALDTGFEAIWQTSRKSYFKKRVSAFGVLLLVGLVGIIGLAITFASSQLLGWIDVHGGPALSVLTFILGLLLSPAATFLIFFTLYRVIPREKPSYRDIFWGALVAALLLDASEYVLGYYFTSISKHLALYGSLGVVLGVVIWLYLVGILIFLGAEIVRTLHLMRINGDSEPDEAEPDAR